MSDWDDIKRLAADFQKIQLSSTLQKLSEPNCIEVVNLLVEQQLINVIYTIDGKEYITPEHFRREIEDELYALGGRANAVALAKALNVDLSRVNHVAEQMAADSAGSIHFVLGQLMTDTYLQAIAAEINDTLAQKGVVSVFELASGHYDLPTEFLQQHVMQRFVGTVIQARQDAEDANKYFTSKYINRCRARLRGALAALTLPTPVATFFAPIGAQDAMYHQLISELGPRGVVTSRQKGALYVPTVYTKTQCDWVNSFYKQNAYLEYDAVARLGVTAPQTFIKRQLAAGQTDAQTTYLSKCCVDQRLIGQLEASLEECIATGSYLDATTVLPSAIAEEDVESIVSGIVKSTTGKQNLPQKQQQTQLFGTTILTTKFIDDLVNPCTELAAVKAKESVESGKYQQHIIDTQLAAVSHKQQQNHIAGSGAADFDDEGRGDRKDDRRRKAAGGKAGGGSQGRETKTKSTKKHNRGGRNAANQSDSEDETTPVSAPTSAGSNTKRSVPPARLELITLADIERVIAGRLDEEGLAHLTTTLATHFVPQFTRLALEHAQRLHAATVQQNAHSAHSAHQDRRQTHAALQERLNNALVDIRLYERGLKLLPPAQHGALIKYLLRTLGTDVTNELHAFAASESSGATVTSNVVWTPELRTKIVQECDAEYKAALGALNKTVASGTSVDDFLGAAETALHACSMILKKIDKKKDRQLILCHKHGLLGKLTNCQDPALVLHLVVLVVFTVSMQSIVHASGKHVAALLSFLLPVLSDEQSTTLRRFHDLVLRLLNSAETSAMCDADENVGEANDDTNDASNDARRETLAEIDTLLPQVKDIASTYKKSGAAGTLVE